MVQWREKHTVIYRVRTTNIVQLSALYSKQRYPTVDRWRICTYVKGASQVIQCYMQRIRDRTKQTNREEEWGEVETKRTKETNTRINYLNPNASTGWYEMGAHQLHVELHILLFKHGEDTLHLVRYSTLRVVQALDEIVAVL